LTNTGDTEASDQWPPSRPQGGDSGYFSS
jgi:hypothetical protein